MIYRKVKGVCVPALGLGTFGLRGAEGLRSVQLAIEIGYRHIDTAQRYENEEVIGEALRLSGVPREEIFLTTKIWHTDLAYGTVQRLADDSLRRLGTDYVDLFLVHWPNPDIPLEETLVAFAEVQAQAKARHIGVSNFPIWLLQKAMSTIDGPDLFGDQVEYHPFLDQSRLLAFLKARQMLLTAYMPLAKGAVADHPVLKEIAETRGCSPQQIGLRWLVQQDGVAAIPRSRQEANLRANMAIFDFELSPSEMARIDQLRGSQRLGHPTWAPKWD